VTRFSARSGRKRIRIASGIYRDRSGLAATVKIGNRQRERRFPIDTPLEEIKTWQATTRAWLWTQAPRPSAPSTRGTLDGDTVTYLKQLEGRPCYGSDRSHLKAWSPLYGPRRRASLRPEDVILAIAQWRTADVAAQTIIHRCRVLRQLFHALDGATAGTPVDHVQRPKKPKPVPVTVPLATIRRVGEQLTAVDPIMAARYWVLATTGQRPAQVMRALPSDVSLKRAIWLVRAAKGSEVRELFLNGDMIAAWKLFIKRKAWGNFDQTAYARTLRACGWPEMIRPYNLRHSFAVSALEQGIDLGDVQGMLGHTEIDTTRTFYAAILPARLKQASQRMEGRLPAALASARASVRAVTGSKQQQFTQRREGQRSEGTARKRA
jgi:site-specific recombinase XerD